MSYSATNLPLESARGTFRLLLAQLALMMCASTVRLKQRIYFVETQRWPQTINNAVDGGTSCLDRRIRSQHGPVQHVLRHALACIPCRKRKDQLRGVCCNLDHVGESRPDRGCRYDGVGRDHIAAELRLDRSEQFGPLDRLTPRFQVTRDRARSKENLELLQQKFKVLAEANDRLLEARLVCQFREIGDLGKNGLAFLLLAFEALSFFARALFFLASAPVSSL